MVQDAVIAPLNPNMLKILKQLEGIYMDDKKLKEHLENAKTIAVIGFSKDPSKTAYRIPHYLTKYYKIYPVNPNAEIIDGLQCYKSIKDVPEQVDIVDIFRPSSFCGDIVKEIVTLPQKPKLIWLQLRITNEDAKKLAQENKIDYIEDACIYVERERLLN